jgi:ABC-type lipoprotein release transport system permease subunit
MSSILSASLWQQRLWSAVFLVFAGVAVALAMIGIYGVLAWSVRQRHQELAIRAALGAPPATVIRLVVDEGLRLALAGLVLGLAVAAVAARSVASLLFGVHSGDPVTWIGVAIVVPLACGGACYLPARHAARVSASALFERA